MRHLLIATALAVAVSVPSAHAASSFKPCGNASATLTHVQAKHMTCRQAKRFVRSDAKPGVWHCHRDGARHRCQTIDTRTHRLKAVRWTEG
jgi:hypothetical protein